ncbi:MAG: hypothetical protein CM1200mP18_05180 [Gammaproteobacteria bacterium]|nr:MAG: hypothetical protein CM1200mP18_05180 [Gammaproteobacteria bacterium]
MMVELKKIQQELGITFIMVTHSQQEALSMADKVIVMSDAMIQQIGTSGRFTKDQKQNLSLNSSETTTYFQGLCDREVDQLSSCNGMINCSTLLSMVSLLT